MNLFTRLILNRFNVVRGSRKGFSAGDRGALRTLATSLVDPKMTRLLKHEVTTADGYSCKPGHSLPGLAEVAYQGAERKPGHSVQALAVAVPELSTSLYLVVSSRETSPQRTVEIFDAQGGHIGTAKTTATGNSKTRIEWVATTPLRLTASPSVPLAERIDGFHDAVARHVLSGSGTVA